jgi:putative ABC transport system permease protein
MPRDGLLLSDTLAELLRVGPGDRVTVEVLEGQRPVVEVPVAAVVKTYLGTAAYMEIGALNRLMREGPVVSGAFLRADAARAGTLYTDLKQTPRVGTVAVKRAALDSFQKTMAENILRMRLFNLTFASIIAFGVIYNSARISLAERAHELATLRILGFTRAEVSGILLGELAVLTVCAVPIGLVMGRILTGIAAAALRTETHRIPLVINPSTYAFAVTVIFVAALLSGLVVRRGLDRLDLVAVLKTKG